MELRNSIFNSSINAVRSLIADVRDQQSLTYSKLLEEIKSSLEAMPNITGVVSSKRLVFAFPPFSADPSSIDTSIYENDSNIVVNYGLERDAGSGDSVIETKAMPVIDMQVALLTFYWQLKTGTGTVPSIDISFDKDPDNGEELSGAWLVKDNRIAAIEDGKQIDVSGIPSPSFAIRWTIPDPSTYKILDTTVDIMLINSSMLIESQNDIVLIAAANILRRQALSARKSGQDGYAESLEGTAKSYIDEARGRLGAGKTPSTGVAGFGHGYNREERANAAFGKSKQGTYVQIVGNVITGKRLRFIPDD